MSNSRWSKDAIRYSNERKVDSVRYLRMIVRGKKRWVLEEDTISEHSYVNQRLHQRPAGFYRGARVH